MRNRTDLEKVANDKKNLFQKTTLLKDSNKNNFSKLGGGFNNLLQLLGKKRPADRMYQDDQKYQAMDMKQLEALLAVETDLGVKQVLQGLIDQRRKNTGTTEVESE